MVTILIFLFCMTISKQTLLIILASLGAGLIIGASVGKMCTISRMRHMPDRPMMMKHTDDMYNKGMMDHSRMNMHDMMTSMTKNLEGKTGTAFDQAFISEMIPHHQGAVEMAQLVLTSTERPELKEMAQAIIDAQTKEIKMMQEWQTEWFTTTTN